MSTLNKPEVTEILISILQVGDIILEQNKFSQNIKYITNIDKNYVYTTHSFLSVYKFKVLKSDLYSFYGDNNLYYDYKNREIVSNVRTK